MLKEKMPRWGAYPGLGPGRAGARPRPCPGAALAEPGGGPGQPASPFVQCFVLILVLSIPSLINANTHSYGAYIRTNTRLYEVCTQTQLLIIICLDIIFSCFYQF